MTLAPRERNSWTIFPMFSVYSSTGTCCRAQDPPGRAASLAPKNTITASGGGPPSGKSLSRRCNAHLK